jgi:hypothetical protein
VPVPVPVPVSATSRSYSDDASYPSNKPSTSSRSPPDSPVHCGKWPPPGPELAALFRGDPKLAHAVVDIGPRLTRVLAALLVGLTGHAGLGTMDHHQFTRRRRGR